MDYEKLRADAAVAVLAALVSTPHSNYVPSALGAHDWISQDIPGCLVNVSVHLADLLVERLKEDGSQAEVASSPG